MPMSQIYARASGGIQYIHSRGIPRLQTYPEQKVTYSILFLNPAYCAASLSPELISKEDNFLPEMFVSAKVKNDTKD